jgi:hypothetical protein
MVGVDLESTPTCSLGKIVNDLALILLFSFLRDPSPLDFEKG